MSFKNTPAHIFLNLNAVEDAASALTGGNNNGASSSSGTGTGIRRSDKFVDTTKGVFLGVVLAVLTTL